MRQEAMNGGYVDVGSAAVGRNDWRREYQLNSLVAGGIAGASAEAITNLLQLHSMEAYQGGDGQGGSQWRIQLQRHAFKINYLVVPNPASMHSWVATCGEVEAFFGHKP